MKKIYIGLWVLVLVVLVIGGIYWQSQKAAISPIEKELTVEEDIAELEELEKDASLENLEQDLTDITEEVPAVETASLENTETELGFELSDFSNDLSDLKGFESDISLDNLDTGLSNVVE